MTKREVREVLREHGFEVLKIDKVPSNGNLFILAFNGFGVYEIYVSFDVCYASSQFMSSVSVHDPERVDWFDEYFN